MQGDVFPIHQRVPPSVRRMERRAVLLLFNSLILFPFSKRSGPAWSSCLASDVTEREPRREIEAAPAEDSL